MSDDPERSCSVVSTAGKNSNFKIFTKSSLANSSNTWRRTARTDAAERSTWENVCAKKAGTADNAPRSANASLMDSVASRSTRVPSAQRRSTAADIGASIRPGFKIPVQKSIFTSNTPSRSRTGQSVKNESGSTKTCNCCHCSPLDSALNPDLQQLKGKMNDLFAELCEQKNLNQVLKQNFLVAKRVVELEVLAADEDFYSSLKKAGAESWKGKQNIIFDLKHELSNLKEAVKRMENQNIPVFPRRMLKLKNVDCSELLAYDRITNWCVHLEREEVWKQADRHKKQLVSNRCSLKKNLKSLVHRKKILLEEVSKLRAKISNISKQPKEGLVDCLPDLESHLKTCIEEKMESRRKLDHLEEQRCRNNKTLAELKAELLTVTQTLKEKEQLVETLKADGTTLGTIAEEVAKSKHAQDATFKEQLDEKQKSFAVLCVKVEQLLGSSTGSNTRLEKFRKLQLKKSCIDIKDIRENLSTRDDEDSIASGDGPKSEITGPNCNRMYIYEQKLLKFLMLFQALDRRNEAKMQCALALVIKTKENVFEFLRKRHYLWKSISDTNLLKCCLKKYRKLSKCPSKLKLVKKKESSLQMGGTLDEGKMSLAARISESKCLKSLIRYVVAGKEDDCDFLASLLVKNRDDFLKWCKVMKRFSQSCSHS